MIRQPYPASIALRYLRARKQSTFISFISAVSMLGIALSVAVLIIVMAVINGFESELERRILSIVPDATLSGWEQGHRATISDWQGLRALALARDDVLAAAPYVEGAGLAAAGEHLSQVAVRGIEPALEPGVSNLGEHMISGSLDELADGWTIVIGKGLADLLDVGLGGQVYLHVPEVNVSLAGARPTYRVFTVVGIFEVGLAEFDRGLVLIGLDQAMRLYRMHGRATGISLKVDDVYAAESIVWDFGNEVLGRFDSNYLPEDWSYRHSNIFRSIELTRPLLFIVLSLVMAIAAFNIVSTLFMVVREKRGDIAILRSIGSRPRSILGIFVVQGSSIGVMGVLAGLALGLLLVASLGTIVAGIESWFAIDLLDPDVYLIGELPTEARVGEIVRICGLAFSLAVLATLYPAYRAARQAPAEALRNE
jgi:lipoprotein-releasing system permease protein